MTSTDRGRKAEAAAADYLSSRGYQIVNHNWRTRFCEIDIVAQKDDTMHFVEVKYRHTAREGKGLEYITSQKLRQMHFAAELWVSMHGWEGEYVVSAVEVFGDDYDIGLYVENASD